MISIGLVEAHTCASFYAECSDSYVVEECSEFCKAVVLPLLEGGPVAMSLSDIQQRLAIWLTGFESRATLVCDSPRDATQLEMLFPAGIPGFCSIHVLWPWENIRHRIRNFGRRIHKANSLRVHHSLDDALANKIIFSDGH